MVIQHCKPQKVSGHTHPFEVFSYGGTEGKADFISDSARSPMITLVRGLSHCYSVQKPAMFGSELRKMIKTLFKIDSFVLPQLWMKIDDSCCFLIENGVINETLERTCDFSRGDPVRLIHITEI